MESQVSDRESAHAPTRSHSSATASPLGGRTRGRARAAGIPEGRETANGLARDSLFRRSLAAADVLAFASSLLIVAAVVGGDAAANPALFFALPFIIAINKVIGLYDRDQHLLKKTTLDEAPRLFNVATLCSVGVWLVDPLMGAASHGRKEFVLLWGLLVVTLIGGRACARRIANRISPVERCIVLGDSTATSRIQKKFETVPGLKSRVVGRVPLAPSPQRDSKSLGTIDGLGLTLVAEDVERVIIAPSDSDSEEDILYGIRLVKSLGVKVSVLPRLFEAVGSSVEFDDVHGVTLLGLRPYGLTDSSWYTKRALDIAISSVVLIVLAPLMCMIAAAISLTSRGGVFFRQPRIGFGGRPFGILKFRTMYPDAEERKAALRSRNEADGLFKIEDDPRVTPVGRWLRKTSLDELPQLLNVLRGDMSLVGPRPALPEEVSQYPEWFRRRLTVLPGLTGLWQVSGRFLLSFHEACRLDVFYVDHWSMGLDLKILLRTPSVVLSGRGAR